MCRPVTSALRRPLLRLMSSAIALTTSSATSSVTGVSPGPTGNSSPISSAASGACSIQATSMSAPTSGMLRIERQRHQRHVHGLEELVRLAAGLANFSSRRNVAEGLSLYVCKRPAMEDVESTCRNVWYLESGDYVGIVVATSEVARCRPRADPRCGRVKGPDKPCCRCPARRTHRRIVGDLSGPRYARGGSSSAPGLAPGQNISCGTEPGAPAICLPRADP